jgi:antitoxin component YwqK of YwqJK toxin-antitoxin module
MLLMTLPILVNGQEKVKEFYESKRLKSVSTQNDGVLDGMFIEWYENGNKKAKGNFQGGQKKWQMARVV